MRFLNSLVLIALSVGAHAEEKSFPNIDILEIDSPVGSVFLTASKHENEVKIQYKKRSSSFFEQNCRIDYNSSGRTMGVSVHPLFKGGDTGSCFLDIHVSLPLEKTVNLSLANGNVYAKGAFYKLTTEMGSGNILFSEKNWKGLDSHSEVKGFSTKIAALNMGSGKVEMDFDFLPEHSDISVGTGSGSVTLSTNTVPKTGKIKLELAKGDSLLNLPKNSIFSAEFSSVWGRLSSELPISEKAAFLIQGSAAIGAMKIVEKKKK